MIGRYACTALVAAAIGAAAAGTAGYWLGRKASASARSEMQARDESNTRAKEGHDEPSPPSSQSSAVHPVTAADREAELRITFRDLPSAALEKIVGEVWSRRSSPQRDRELRLALEMLARRDAALALELAGREQNIAVRTMLIAGVVAGWMTDDPAAALAWTAQAGHPEFTDAAFEQLAVIDLSRAMQLVGELNLVSQDFRWNALRAIVDGRLMEGDFARARGLAEQAATEDLKMFLAGQVASTWVQHDPLAAAQWVAALPPGENQSQILLRVGSIWAGKDPEAAANFASLLPAGSSRQEMLAHVLIEWVGRDLAAASLWADRLEPSRENDVAITAIATDAHLALVNPRVALSWAESVVGPEVRLQAIEEIVQQWASRHAAAARQYVEASPGLGMQERADLLAALRAGSETGP